MVCIRAPDRENEDNAKCGVRRTGTAGENASVSMTHSKGLWGGDVRNMNAS